LVEVHECKAVLLDDLHVPPLARRVGGGDAIAAVADQDLGGSPLS
jgi:hypothetical protein